MIAFSPRHPCPDKQATHPFDPLQSVADAVERFQTVITIMMPIPRPYRCTTPPSRLRSC